MLEKNFRYLNISDHIIVHVLFIIKKFTRKRFFCRERILQLATDAVTLNVVRRSVNQNNFGLFLPGSWVINWNFEEYFG